MIWVYIFVIGAIIGSFINVVIYRYPIQLELEWNKAAREQLHLPEEPNSETFNLCVPRSHCPHCKHKIPVKYNIPLISFLWLRATCFYCHQKISAQYFIVELLCAILSVVIFIKFGITLAAFSFTLLTYGLIALSFIDFRHQFLPDPIVYIFMWLGLIISMQYTFVSPAASILGAIVGYLFLWIIAKAYFLIRKQEGMGLGDCKMLAMIGSWTGPFNLIYALMIAAILALLVGFILMRMKKMTKDQLIPFGPFIGIGGWITILMLSNSWVMQ